MNQKGATQAMVKISNKISKYCPKLVDNEDGSDSIHQGLPSAAFPVIGEEYKKVRRIKAMRTK